MTKNRDPNTKRPVFIYALKDPFTDEIRYIGKSIRPKERLTNECNEHSNTHRCHWIQSILAKGKKPIQIILEEVPDGVAWQDRECYWIAEGKRLGWPLVNGTSGGDGVKDLTPEAKAKMLKTWTGRKHKPETLAKIGASSKGRKHNQESKEYMRRIMSGREITWGDKVSLGTRKFPRDKVEEVRALLAGGATVQSLAKSYGVHRTTITKIKLFQKPYTI